MPPSFLSYLQTLLPFSPRKPDDLKVSESLVCRLSIPEQIKQFIFAIHEPETQSVVYILAAQNLSERAAFDAACLINKVRPEAVVAQVSPSALIEILPEERESRDNLGISMPTTSFEVLKGCIIHKTCKEVYENTAGLFVLREIFGVGFHEHHLVAKKAAENVGSSFFLLESPYINSGSNSCTESGLPNKVQEILVKQCSLTPRRDGSVFIDRFFLTNDLQAQMMKSLSSYIQQSTTVSELEFVEFQLRCNYPVPHFAQIIYPLLTDLHDIFVDLPSIGRALTYAQKMLSDVERGETVDTQLLSEVQTFRLAVEGLRIALNKAARCPISKLICPDRIEFSDLPMGDKSHFLLAQALRNHTKKFKSVVAIVEARSLAGLRKYWRAPVTRDVEDSVKRLVKIYEYENDNDSERATTETIDRTKLLTDKPIVAVGAGATAVLGASSIPKLISVSTFLKLVTLKTHVSLKLYTQKAVAMGLSKSFGPSRMVARGLASYGVKTTSVLKAASSAQKIRAVAHSLVVCAEQTSISVMRTAFYEIMRKRGVQQIGPVPWTTLGCSAATFSGLFMYGDNIEFAAESLPTAPSIARLGRGIRNLHQASQVVRQANNSKMQETLKPPYVQM